MNTLAPTVLDKNASRPLFYQVADHYRERIRGGEWAPGEHLPKVTHIAAELAVNYRTVRQAFRILEQAGVIRLEAGRAIVRDAGTPPAAGRSNTIGVVLPVVNVEHMVQVDHYGFNLFYSLSAAASRRGYHTQAMSLHGVAAQAGEPPPRAGLICLLPTALHLSFLPESLTRGVPLVLLGTERPNCGCVHGDHRDGLRQLVGHLASLGHRHFAYLSGPIRDFANLQRLESFLESLARHGLPLHPSCLAFHENYHVDNPEELAGVCARFLAAEPRPTAWISSRSGLAIALLHLLRRRGLRVPDDVSVAGYDDTEATLACDPPLTTVQQPLDQLGQTAIELLCAMLAGAAPERRILPVRLIARASTGPAPAFPLTATSSTARD